jgi:hypothetical protein
MPARRAAKAQQQMVSTLSCTCRLFYKVYSAAIATRVSLMKRNPLTELRPLSAGRPAKPPHPSVRVRARGLLTLATHYDRATRP